MLLKPLKHNENWLNKTYDMFYSMEEDIFACVHNILLDVISPGLSKYSS